MDISKLLTPDLIELRTKFLTKGFDIRFVGGCVRDILWNKNPKDIDLCTNANPDQQIEIYKEFDVRYVETGLQHGTITVILNHIPYEITSLRIDTECDGRHATVQYVTDWIADLSRRDFTINAMSIDFDGNLIDPFDGYKDLQNGIVRFVGNPVDRITEDYLRILRWFRFMGRMGPYDPTNEINVKTSEIIADLGKKGSPAEKLSRERIWTEIKKIVVGPNGIDMIELIHYLKISSTFGLPESTTSMTAIAQRISTSVENPITLLVFLYSFRMAETAIQFKASGAEIALCKWLIKAWTCDPITEPMYYLAVDKIPIEWVVEFMKIAEYDGFQIAVIEGSEIPIFPITGEDLIDIGIPQNKNFGVIMNKLKKNWAKNNYASTSAELLDEARNLLKTLL